MTTFFIAILFQQKRYALAHPYAKCRANRGAPGVDRQDFSDIPQGSPVSPLLANVYMRRFVVAWKQFGLNERLGSFIVTYADVDACSPFIFTENLVLEKEEKADVPTQLNKKSKNELRKDTALVKLLKTAADQTSENDGWSHMGRVGHYISNKSSFSSINYGYTSPNLLRMLNCDNRVGYATLWLTHPTSTIKNNLLDAQYLVGFPDFFGA